MARVKLGCIMGCAELKNSYQEKGLLYVWFVNITTLTQIININTITCGIGYSC